MKQDEWRKGLERGTNITLHRTLMMCVLAVALALVGALVAAEDVFAFIHRAIRKVHSWKPPNYKVHFVTITVEKEAEEE